MVLIKRTEAVEKVLYTASRNVKWCNLCESSLEGLQKAKMELLYDWVILLCVHAKKMKVGIWSPMITIVY